MPPSRLERLLNLTAALLTAPRPLTAAEVAERVPGYPLPAGGATFKRAFERDKDSLRDMGIPLVLTPIEGVDPPVEGYVIPRDQYELRDPGLEPDELAALHLAAAAVELEGLRGSSALWKLGGAPPSGNGATEAATAAVAPLPATPLLVPLFEAVAERTPVTFAYRGEEREVEPWRLAFRRGHWYLEGFDRDRGAERQFRLDRVEGEVALGESGTAATTPAPARGGAPPPPAPRPWQYGEGDPVVASLLVDADQAPWAADRLGDEAVTERRADGAVVFALPVTNREAFRSFVLGFLDHAEVLAPPELRDDVAAWLRGLVDA
jgi:predicted DNA-binding transcriptional regulator YafY